MGWASGSYLMELIIEGAKQEFPDHDLRKRMYKIIIPAMRDQDWDTELECLEDDDAYAEALMELYPGWFEGE